MRFNFWFWKEQISQSLCKEILEELAGLNWSPGTVLGEKPLDFALRATEIAWLPRMHLVECVLAHFGRAANTASGWCLQLSDEQKEAVQLARYGVNSFYGSHTDLAQPADRHDRKLTCVLQLSDPSDYEGGDLEIAGNLVDKAQGTIVVFPSFFQHQVIPVTAGTRVSATLWLTGPGWK